MKNLLITVVLFSLSLSVFSEGTVYEGLVSERTISDRTISDGTTSAGEVSERLNSEGLSGLQIMEKVNKRNDGMQVSRTLTLTLTDRRGISRTEKTQGYRKYFGFDKKTILFYSDPSNVRGTGFLTFDYADSKVEDDQWLYLPALRKVRRISASNRGDYFLGTDLSYEEIKKENKVEIADYQFSYQGEDNVDGFRVLLVKSIPINDTIARELGYSKLVLAIDPSNWISRKTEFWDINGNHLKTVSNQQIKKIDDIWTVTRIEVENHKTKHHTLLQFDNIDYQTEVDDDIFTQQHLRRGLR